jgi:hypothetical protein
MNPTRANLKALKQPVANHNKETLGAGDGIVFRTGRIIAERLP